MWLTSVAERVVLPSVCCPLQPTAMPCQSISLPTYHAPFFASPFKHKGTPQGRHKMSAQRRSPIPTPENTHHTGSSLSLIFVAFWCDAFKFKRTMQGSCNERGGDPVAYPANGLPGGRGGGGPSPLLISWSMHHSALLPPPPRHARLHFVA